MTDTFTLFYCMWHDDGFILAGNHISVPFGYVTRHSNKCNWCDWYKMGVIQANGTTFDVIERVRVDYDTYYGGGFKFCMYENTLTDEKGNAIENELLDTWIREINEKQIVYLE
jgi:hypothetical protein